jgi:hypothetical protein
MDTSKWEAGIVTSGRRTERFAKSDQAGVGRALKKPKGRRTTVVDREADEKFPIGELMNRREFYHALPKVPEFSRAIRERSTGVCIIVRRNYRTVRVQESNTAR